MTTDSPFGCLTLVAALYIAFVALCFLLAALFDKLAKRNIRTPRRTDGDDDQPTADGEPRTVDEHTQYVVRTYTTAFGLPSPAEVAAANVDAWRAHEGKERGR